MKYLVAFGCSHTNGSMLDGASGSSYENTRNGFPGMLARKYDYHLYNISKPGGSNEYIHRSVIEYVTTHMDHNADQLFLINWTSRPRLEFRYPENYLHETWGDFVDKKSVPFTVGSNPRLFHDNRYEQLQTYCPYFINSELEAEKWATWAYGLQCLLENLNIPYLMSNTCEALPVIEENKKITQHLNTNNYIEPFETQSTMLEYLLAKGFEKTACWHFREDGHAAWAEKLETHLKELNYVE